MAQLPQGMNDDDYDAIEAAVTETVRGRWFLNEFARRNRAGEMREILSAVTRLEGSIGSGQTVLPADPSVRLLMQRVKEISGQLDRLAGEMRLADADERFIDRIEEQGRAVAGMMRGPTLPTKPVAQSGIQAAPEPPRRAAALPAPVASAASPMPTTKPPAPKSPATKSPVPSRPVADPRLQYLASLDELPMAEKLALFA